MTRQPILYSVLEVDRSANREEIRQAYLRLLRNLHPDLQPPQRPEELDRVRERLQSVMDAYAILGDPVRRAEYDRATGVQRPQPVANWPAADPHPIGGEFPSWRRPATIEDFLEYLIRRRFFL